MCELGELEAHQYRRLWLDTAAELGLVSECLAEVLAWQRSDEQPLPDPLALAETAAQRLRQLQAALEVYQPRLRGRRERVREVA